MKRLVYVNKNTLEVITHEKFVEYVNMRAVEREDDDDQFADWLKEQGYTLFSRSAGRMTTERRFWSAGLATAEPRKLGTSWKSGSSVGWSWGSNPPAFSINFFKLFFKKPLTDNP